jgi:hypothetical protein
MLHLQNKDFLLETKTIDQIQSYNNCYHYHAIKCAISKVRKLYSFRLLSTWMLNNETTHTVINL